MEHISYFKLQAKILLKDYKTRYFNEERKFYCYHPKHFDIGDLFFYFEYPDQEDDFSFTLMNAQHLIAKMVGYDEWEDLIHASESEHELAEFLLHRFRNSQDIQDWEDTLSFTGLDLFRTEAAESVLDYARQYYELGERKQIVSLPADRITVLLGKQRKEELMQFDDEHNPAGLLRTDSVVYCSHCRQSFEFSKSKVIKDNETNRTMVVCKNYPNCKNTYLDFRVLTPTILYGDEKMRILEEGVQRRWPRIEMDSKVRCLHCGEEYTYKEAKVVVSPDNYGENIHCKNYPQCDGTSIDLIKVDD